MENNKYLKLLMAFALGLFYSCFLLHNEVKTSIDTTMTKTNYQYSGTNIENYYASEGDFYGGATYTGSEEVVSATVTFESGKSINHNIEKDIISVEKLKNETSNPQTMVLFNELGEEVETINLQSSLGILYYYSDENMTYHHIYMNQAGIFLGNVKHSEFVEDANHMISLEFCHKDASKSQGYAVFARADVTYSNFCTGKDLGYVAYDEYAKVDLESDIYVLIHINDNLTIEIPLTKGVI